MAKKSSVEKQKRRQAQVTSRFAQRQALKKIISDPDVEQNEKIIAMDKLNSLPRDSVKIRLRNRCMLTGRPRAYLRKFGLSRLCFREMASQGLIPGVVKASW